MSTNSINLNNLFPNFSSEAQDINIVLTYNQLDSLSDIYLEITLVLVAILLILAFITFRFKKVKTNFLLTSIYNIVLSSFWWIKGLFVNWVLKGFQLEVLGR